MSEEIKNSVVYKQKGQKVYVLSANCQVLGVWTNLKQLCYDRLQIEKFASYSTLSKVVAQMKKDNDESFTFEVATKDGKTYQLKMEILQ